MTLDMVYSNVNLRFSLLTMNTLKIRLGPRVGH